MLCVGLPSVTDHLGGMPVWSNLLEHPSSSCWPMCRTALVCLASSCSLRQTLHTAWQS